jgi:Xaa-Pro aminopeptidase
MRPQFLSLLPLPRRLRPVSSVLIGGWLLLAGPSAIAQVPTSIPEPLVESPAPARPTDFLSPAFHKQRRELLRAQMPANSVAVVFAAPVRNRANDVSYIYHQNPDFYYLTGYDEPDAVLLLFKEPCALGGQSGVTEMLFTQPRNPAREAWTGRRLGAAGAKTKLGLQHAADNQDFAAVGIKWADFDKVLVVSLPDDARDDLANPADLHSLVVTFRQQAGVPASYSPGLSEIEQFVRHVGPLNGKLVSERVASQAKDNPAIAASPLISAFLAATNDAGRKAAIAAFPPGRFDDVLLGEKLTELRAIKTPEELALLRRAIRISTQGQREVMKLMRPDMGEMDVQGLHEYVYRRYGAEFQGYPSIVGGGANGCILHYETNDRQRLDNDLVLMDCGAEYHGYTADVTRTAPPSGTFSPAQRQIYELVLAAQEAGFAACRPGASFDAPNKATQEVVAAGLQKLGIIKKKEEFRRYYPHGASHYLGLDVHDSGNYGPLQAGNVITVEPGIYIPAGSPCDPKWWNIGVRIEDDALITATGYENLSAEAPRTVADIEKLMAEPSALEGFKLPELK